MRRTLSIPILGVLVACGGGSDSSPTAPTAVPTPAAARAAITATGAGPLVVHPSLNPTFAVALETPVRIQETGGGTADWHFARFSLFLEGAEIERGEIGSDVIRNAGFSRIAARSNDAYNLIFRFNSGNFDRVDIVLGFGDVVHGNQFTASVPFNSFTDVNVSLTPLSVPAEGAVRLEFE